MGEELRLQSAIYTRNTQELTSCGYEFMSPSSARFNDCQCSRYSVDIAKMVRQAERTTIVAVPECVSTMTK